MRGYTSGLEKVVLMINASETRTLSAFYDKDVERGEMKPGLAHRSNAGKLERRKY